MKKLKELLFRPMDMGVDGKTYTMGEHSFMTLAMSAIVTVVGWVLLLLPFWLGIAGFIAGYIALLIYIDKIHKVGVRWLRKWL